MKRRRFTKEFKLEILRELEGKTLAQVCREHDLIPNVVSRWKKDYERDPENAFNGKGNLWKEEARIARYERIIGRQCAEIEFLKKTLDTLQRKRAEEKRWSR